METMPPSAPIQNYLVPAILTTIFCCQPFGIVAIVFAAQVDGLVAAGNYGAALDASNKAKNWSIAAAVSALVVYAVVLVLGLAGIALSALGG
jgi:hypothetical protein